MTKPHTVYLAKAGRLCKIGVTSKTAEERVSRLRSPYGQRARLISFWHMGDEALEFEYMFKHTVRSRAVTGHLGIAGEWFKATREEATDCIEYLLSVFDHSRPRHRMPEWVYG